MRIPKAILFSARILRDVLYQINLDESQGDPRRAIMENLRAVLAEDMKRCNDLNHQEVLENIKKIE